MIWLTFLPVALYDICGWASPAVEAVRTDSSCKNHFGIVNSTNLGNAFRKSVGGILQYMSLVVPTAGSRFSSHWS